MLILINFYIHISHHAEFELDLWEEDRISRILSPTLSSQSKVHTELQFSAKKKRYLQKKIM